MAGLIDEPDMGRRTTYVDKNKLDRLAEMGIDFNALVRSSVELATSEEFEDLAVQGKLRQIDIDLVAIQAELERMSTRKVLLLKQQAELQTIKHHIESTWEQTKHRVHLSHYIRSLNQIIIVNNYNVVTVQVVAKDLIESITRLEPNFQLEPHMMQLKKYFHH